jgi:hypothetical protein
MPWKRNDPPDPLEARRKELEEQQRLLVEQRKRLTEQLHQPGGSPAAPAQPKIHPVWRRDEDSQDDRVADPTPARKKMHLAHQRRRDRIIFFGLMALLLVIVLIVLWVAKVHNSLPTGGT